MTKTKRRRNLFGFGKKTTFSSGAMKSAYSAGYRGEHGHRGTELFNEWLRKQKDSKDFSGGFVSQLRDEYKRGEEDYYAKKPSAHAAPAPSHSYSTTSRGSGRSGRSGPSAEERAAVRREKTQERAQIRREKMEERKQIRQEREQYRRELAQLKAEKREGSKPPPIPKGERASDQNEEYKGHTIRRTQKGWEVLGETWNNVKQAKEFVDLYVVTGGKARVKNRKRNAGPIESTYRSTTSAVSSVGKYLDRELGRAFNPEGDSRPWMKMGGDRTKAEAEKLASKLKSDDRKLRALGSTGNYQDVEVRRTFEGPGRSSDRYTVFVVMKENPRSNPELDRVKPTLTQGDSRAYVIELESRKYLAWVVDGKGERREKEFEGSRSKEAAKAWARLVLFEVAKADRKSNPEIKAMTAGQINKALDKLDAQDSKLTREFIDAGRGHELPSETFKLDDPLARRKKELFHKRMDLRNEMERRYGPGTPSRLPKGFGPIKANPEGGSQSMYESFHGRPSRETIEVSETIHYHKNTAALGTCCGFLIESGSKRFAIGLSGYTWNPRADGPGRRKGGFVHSDPDAEDVILSSNEEGTQLFIDGGDQSLDPASLGITGKEAEHESIVIGDVCLIAYETEKEFDKFETIQYVHTLSEDSKGPLPVLRYMRRNSKGARMFLDGGVYFIEKPLVGTSPGIED